MIFMEAQYSFQNSIIKPKEEEVFRQSYKCSLIVPAYNEEIRIKPFLESIKTKLPLDWEVIIVCDGTDKTADIARKIDDRFRVLSYGKRLGKGGAIKKGFHAATGEIIGYVDADGAIPWESIHRVFETVLKGDMAAVGSRWMKDSKLLVEQSLLRVLLGRIYHYFTVLFLRVYIKDTQCGVKFFKKEVVSKIIKCVTINNLSFDTAFLYHAEKAGYNVKEIPIVWKDVDGSKISPFKTSFIMLITLMGIRLASSKIPNKNKFLQTFTSLILNHL